MLFKKIEKVITPHLSAYKKEIASYVLITGDSKRTKFIADHYLKESKLVSNVRYASVYTGKYKNNLITIATSGMGFGSMAIYSYELFKFFDVKYIIRLGTCGSYEKSFSVYDLINVSSCWTGENHAQLYLDKKINNLTPSSFLFKSINATAKNINIFIRTAKVHSTSLFYSNEKVKEKARKNACRMVEMECFSLFLVSRVLQRHAAAILTVSDNLVTNEDISSIAREKRLTKMMELGLETLLSVKRNKN